MAHAFKRVFLIYYFIMLLRCKYNGKGMRKSNFYLKNLLFQDNTNGSECITCLLWRFAVFDKPFYDKEVSFF